VRRRPSGRNFLAVSALALALILSSVTASLASSPTAANALPAPEDLPPRTVAVVSHVPVRSRTITVRELSRAILQVAAQAGLRSAPTPGQPKYKWLEKEAMGELLDGAWIQGQAEEMGIRVTDKQVATELAQIKKENFKSRKQFHAFLEHAHFTLRDVRYRVELQLLSRRIEERVAIGPWSQQEVQEKFSAFVAAYEKRWRSRTVCAPQYAIKRCSNG
jgi:parvulin-like peptidyl-prolyl isomerase